MTLTSMQSNSDIVVLHVEITRHYGNTSIKLGASVECEVAHEHAHQRAYDEIVDTLILEHRRQAERLRPVATQGGQPAASGELGQNAKDAPAQDAKEHTNIITVTAISVDINKGKRTYKVHGGSWNKFGVRIFPADEAVVSAVKEIDWENLSLEKINPITDGTRALLSMAGGKPVKVLQLLPPDEVM